MSKDDDKNNVTDLPTAGDNPQGPDLPGESPDAKSGAARLVGYILSPESMAELVEQVENVPGRYYKRMAPCLQNASQLIETPDGKFNVLSPQGLTEN